MMACGGCVLCKKHHCHGSATVLLKNHNRIRGSLVLTLLPVSKDTTNPKVFQLALQGKVIG